MGYQESYFSWVRWLKSLICKYIQFVPLRFLFVSMDIEQYCSKTGGSQNEGWGRLLLPSQSWFPRPCIPNASTSESPKFWCLSRSSWVRWRTTIREVWVTMAENTFSKPVFRWCWEAFTWWTPGICGKSFVWNFWFSRKPY